MFIFYFLFFIFSFFLKKESYLFAAFCLCFFLFLFAGARQLGSSPDDFNYYYSLQYKNADFEYFYRWIEDLNRNFFHGDIKIHFMVVSLLSMTMFFFSLWYYKRIALWSVLIYMAHIFLYRDLIQIRAAVGYNIVLLFFVFISERKGFFKPLIILFIAVGFHVSSFIACISFFLKKHRFTLRGYIISLVFLFPLAFFVDFSSVFKLAIPYLPAILNAPLNAYVLDDGGFTYSIGLFNPTTIKTIVFCFCFLYRKEELKRYFGNGFFVELYVFSSFILITLNDFAVFASRVASMFSSVEVLLVPAIVVTAEKKEKIAFIIFFVCIYGVVLFLNLTSKCMLCNYSLDLF